MKLPNLRTGSSPRLQSEPERAAPLEAGTRSNFAVRESWQCDTLFLVR